MQGHLDGTSFPQMVDCDACAGRGTIYSPGSSRSGGGRSSSSPAGVTEMDHLLGKVLVFCVFGGVFGLCLGQAGLTPLVSLIVGGITAFISAKLLYGPLRFLLKAIKFVLFATIALFLIAAITQGLNN